MSPRVSRPNLAGMKGLSEIFAVHVEHHCVIFTDGLDVAYLYKFLTPVLLGILPDPKPCVVHDSFFIFFVHAPEFRKRNAIEELLVAM